MSLEYKIGKFGEIPEYFDGKAIARATLKI